MVQALNDAYARWWWARFIKALDEAGYRIVRKPQLQEVGKPNVRPYV